MFSPFSEAIVLFSIPAVLWHLLWVLAQGGASLRERSVVGGLVIAWAGYMYAHIRYGFATNILGDSPAIPNPPLAANVMPQF